MAQTFINPKDFNRVSRLSSYNHNVYTNIYGIYIRERCDDNNGFYYTLVDSEDNDIKYLGAENFPIFESDKDLIVLDDYFC